MRLHNGAIVWLAVGGVAGCGSLKKDVAEVTYDGQQLECVGRYSAKETIDACRAEVDRAWGRLPDGGRIPDGGTDGSR